jgi:hypothetical protein
MVRVSCGQKCLLFALIRLPLAPLWQSFQLLSMCAMEWLEEEVRQLEEEVWRQEEVWQLPDVAWLEARLLLLLLLIGKQPAAETLVGLVVVLQDPNLRTSMRSLISQVLPIGGEEWEEVVANLHSQQYPDHHRDSLNLRRKFREMYNSRIRKATKERNNNKRKEQ